MFFGRSNYKISDMMRKNYNNLKNNLKNWSIIYNILNIPDILLTD